MAYSGQNICDRVREQINDDYKREVPDAEILNYANDCIKVIYDRRPDYFIGQFASFPTDMTLGTNWPLEDRVLPAVIDYAVAMAQRPDDEDSQVGLSKAALDKFTAFLGA